MICDVFSMRQPWEQKRALFSYGFDLKKKTHVFKKAFEKAAKCETKHLFAIQFSEETLISPPLVTMTKCPV